LNGTIGKNGWFLSDVTIVLLTANNQSSVNVINYCIDNSSWAQYTGPFILNKTGSSNLFFRATDEAGNVETTKTETIKIDITPPVARAGQDLTVNTSSPVHFDGGASTDEIELSSYAWNFGDGATAQGKSVTHTYSAAGTFTVTLTVENVAGNAGVDTTTVTVSLPIAEYGNRSDLLFAVCAAMVISLVFAVTLVLKQSRGKNKLKG
jgi:PKD repeat protein